MLRLPDAVQPLIRGFEKAFTRPSFERFVALSLGAIVTFGRRTVSRILWTLGSAAAGDPSNYHRLFSRARWSLWPLGKVLACAVLELIPPDQPVLCAIDDTILEHRGNHVYAKACHRNAVGSARGMATRWGHRWVVLAVLVKLPFAARPWALPLLCALYRSAALDQKEHRRHQTPCELARHLLAVLLHWFPQRRFIALGDGGFASHDLAWFAHRHRDRLTFIARANPKMNLHVLPPQHTFCRQTLWRRRRGDIGHPRCRRGHKLASPADTVKAARAKGNRSLPTQLLHWYGQSKKLMQIFSAAGGWYRARGNGTGALVPLRWVYTCDPKKPAQQDWFFCTDPMLKPRQIVESFAGRWSIEVSFEEVRAHLGLSSTRQRCRQSVLRGVPWMLGLFSLISLIFTRLWQESRSGQPLHETPCYHKCEPTFSDALYAVRRHIWDGCLLKHVLGRERAATLPTPLKRKLITYLAEAA
jgi:hypothetical protein